MRSRRLTSCAPFLILGSYALICLVFFVDSRWHQHWDSGIYLLTARSIARGHGYNYLDQPFFMKPPGFAYFLSWIVGPAGDLNFYRLNLIIMLLAMCSLAAVYVLMRELHGTMRAIAIALLVGTSPLFVSNFNLVLSEFLFLAFFFLGIWLLLSGTKIWRGLVGVALISASIYVRSVGLVLLPGLIIVSLLNRTGVRKLTGLAQVLLVVILFAPWLQFSSNAEKQAPKPATQLWVFSYATALFHKDPGDPASDYVSLRGWAKRVWLNSRLLIEEIGQNTVHIPNLVWGYVIAILLCVGFFVACRKGSLIVEWFAIAYIGLIVVYFTYRARLLLPLVPLLYSYLFLAVAHIGSWCEKRSEKEVVPTACLVLFVTFFSLNLAFMARYFDPKYGEVSGRSPEIWRTDELAAMWIKKHTAENEIILHKFAPTFAVLTDRRVYSYLWLRKQFSPKVDFVVLRDAQPEFEPYLESHNAGSWIIPGDPKVGSIRIYRVHDIIVPE